MKSEIDFSEFNDLYGKCLSKLRYGNLWEDFTLDELYWYAHIKLKRGLLIYKNLNSVEKAEDDWEDSINLIFMLILKMHEEQKL